MMGGDSVGYANEGSDAPMTRLTGLLEGIRAANTRAATACARVSQMNQHLVGSGGPPMAVDSPSAGSKPSAPQGVVYALEEAVNNLHGTLQELETLTEYLRSQGVVA